MRAPIVLSLLITLAAPPAVRADEPAPMKPETRALLEQGLQHFRNREYEAAIITFEQAYAIEPRDELVFAMAQAERLSGDCASAVILYRKFLANDPNELHAEAARASLDKCGRALASRPVSAEDQAAAAVAPPPTAHDAEADSAALVSPPPTRVSDRAQRAWYRDHVGGALLGAGVAGLGAGAALLAMSATDASAAADADGYAAYVELIDRAQSRRTMAWVGLGAGAALVAGAALRYRLAHSDESLAVAISADPALTGVAVSGRF